MDKGPKRTEDEALESAVEAFGGSLDPVKSQSRLAKIRLKMVRENLGMKQNQFAQKFGVKESTYSRYESGEINRLPLSLITDICKTYSINPAWLMGYPNVEKYIPGSCT